jgi:TonB-linked SusC/RagA family outer membrane protein
MSASFKGMVKVLCAVVIAAPAMAQAQNTTITGTVTGESGTPLQAVSVSIPTLRAGATTNERGEYSFNVPASGQQVTITARRLGFIARSERITLAAGTVTQNFVLNAAATQLTGIVVTALGIEKEKKALGVAQQTIDSSALTEGARTTNLVSALSGRIAGINVTTATTQGGSSRIVIRGATSINGNNQPLFVVDGIAIDNSNYNRSGETSGGGGYDLGNTAQDLNADDIASISVLKGPNAAALYGSRAANGAIIITTKTGSTARGFNVSGSTNVQFDSPLRLPTYQNTWGQGFEGDICDVWNKGQAHFSAGPVPANFDYSQCGFSYVDGNYTGVNDGVDESWGPRLDGTLRSQFSLTTPMGADVRPWVAHPNNVSGFFQAGKTITTNGSAQGSNDRANFRLSLTRQDVDGMVPNNTLGRTTAALSGGARVSQKFSANGNVTYIQNAGNNRPGTGYDEANPMMDFIWFGRQVDIAALKNSHVDPNGDQISWNYSYHNSPWWTQYQNHNRDQRDRVLGVASGTYRFTDWLRATVRTGTDFYRNFNTYQFAAGWIGGGFDGDYSRGGFQDFTRFNQETNTDLLVTAQRNLMSNLGLTVNLGGNKRVNHYRQEHFGTDQLVIPGIYNIGNTAKPVTPDQFVREKRINSMYGQAEFAYNDYLFLNVTGRNDWSSTLPKGSNSYFYPSVAGSFVFTQVFPSLSMGGLLNYGKIRGGWSRVGNDADPYQLSATFSANTQFGGISRFATPNDLLNPDLKPENTDAWEVGTEMQWFDDRMGLDLTYYTKKTSNQILKADVSRASGFSTALVNAGVISNRGVEVQLSLTPIRASNAGGFGWDISVNYGKNKNKVDELYGDLQTVSLGSLWYLSVEARKGQPYGAMFGVGYLRCGKYDPNSTTDPNEKARLAALAAATTACPADGSANGELLLRSNGTPRPEPATAKRVLGVYTPDWTGGWDNTFHFRGVDVGFLLDTRQGGNIYSVGNMWGMYAGVLKGTEFRPDTGLLIQGWNGTTKTQNTKHVRAEDYYHDLYNIQEPWIYDASFVKLREARVAFAIPRRFVRQANISNARLSLVARNLALWCKVPNIDPEAAFSSTNLQGFEMGQMPTARTIGLQLSITP